MPFYNTSSPTASNKNNITDIAVTYGIRDFLLNKNLMPVYPFLSTSLNGSPRIGEPVLDTMVGTGNITQPFGLPLETEGILRMDIAILPNTFKNQSSTANNLTNIDNTTKINLYPNSSWPEGIQQYPNTANDDIKKYGLLGKSIEGQWRKLASIKNLYVDTDKQVDVADWISLNPADITQNIKGYLDVFGGLKQGSSSGIQAANVIGSVLNGQGLGLAKGGVVTNYDVRSSLAGRVLGAAGVINDTKLGMIGGQQLALALANNAAFNVQQQAFGALNVQDNALSLIKNGTLAGFRPNYQITVPSGAGGKILDYTAKILGFTLPKSYLNDSGSIFQTENGYIENITRANNMILNTGKGQVVSLLKNITANNAVNSISKSTNPFRIGYAPAYTDNKGVVQISDGFIYAFSKKGHLINPLSATDGVIPDMSYLRDSKIEDSGFGDIGDGVNYQMTGPFSPNKFTWASAKAGNTNTIDNWDIGTIDPKSILYKTQKLFNSKGMMNIVSSKGDMNINTSNQIVTTNGNGISKGNAVLTKNSFDSKGRVASSFKTAEETYCRSWTTFDRYDKVERLVRSSGLEGNAPYRNQMLNSTLDEYGFPKIAPYITDSKTSTDPKNFMFSIENLAWDGSLQKLLEHEKGPGDLISGRRGRIMWFPPYNIQFSETSSVSWEANNFIGRGESVYTYNNTERAGNLSFQIIVDHSSYVNSFRGIDGPDDSYVASFFAGCTPLDSKFADKLTVDEFSSAVKNLVPKSQSANIEPQTPPPTFSIYFANDVDQVNTTYENGLSGSTQLPIDYTVYTSGYGLGSYPGSFTSSGPWDDNHNYGLNGENNEIIIDNVVYKGWFDPLLVSNLNVYLTEKCPDCVVKVTGFASAQGVLSVNQKLANARRDSVIETLKAQLFLSLPKEEKELKFIPMDSKPLPAGGCVALSKAPTDTIDCKKDRRVDISFVFDPRLSADKVAQPDVIVKKPSKTTFNGTIKNRFYNETKYFEQLTDSDSFVFDKFRDKIRYFHPAFHSTTPEGLNSRLTFLNQCTRQGPTLTDQGADNLAFGKPPVCILRIGDFYNTKIIIDNLSIDYEPLVWDLNPEGIGVQPMIANVNMSFKFVGGSTLMGPINKLQNALSFNYYANSQVYDPRADYIAKISDELKTTVNSIAGANMKLPDYLIINGVTDVDKELNKLKSQAFIEAEAAGVNQEETKEKNETGASAIKDKPNTTGFTIDNITTINESFNVASSSYFISTTLALKTDTNNNVILPTGNFQIDFTLIRSIEPKESKTTDELLNICLSDTKTSSSTFFLNSILLKPDGIQIIDSDGKAKTDSYTNLNLIQIKPNDDRIEAKSSILTAINQTNGLIACNVLIQDAKPVGATKIYNIDNGYRLKLDIKDLTTNTSKSITLTKMVVITN